MRLLYHRLGEVVLGLLLVSIFVVFGGLRPLSEALSTQDKIVPEAITGEYNESDTAGVFHGQQVISARAFAGNLAKAMPAGRQVLGESTGTKRIEVDLTNQRVYAYEGDRKVYDFVVSTGKWGRTPTGTFTIWGKGRYQKMSGGSGSTYYYLPNVPYIMWFAGDGVSATRGFSLHGTYWHNNFGYPMSHGCVNMRTEDAGTLFYWSEPSMGEAKMVRASASTPGTEVRIYGETPVY